MGATSTWATMKNLVKKILNRFDCKQKFFRSLSDNVKVLDLGCGGGANGIVLRAMHTTVELQGLDIEPQTNLPGFYLFKTVDLDSGVLPFSDNYFDAVIFTHVIEHLRSPLKLGKEINRVMRKGAKIYVETPNWTTAFAPSFGFHREQHNPFNFYDDPTHVKPWSKHGLFEFLVQSCGLNVVKIGNTRNWVRLPFDLIILLYGLLTANRSYVVWSFWNLYGWCIYGVAIKEL